jgi:hypothetical protein
MSFVIIGIAFLAIGASGRRSFVGIGAAFVAIGMVFLMRHRRAGRLK